MGAPPPPSVTLAELCRKINKSYNHLILDISELFSSYMVLIDLSPPPPKKKGNLSICSIYTGSQTSLISSKLMMSSI